MLHTHANHTMKKLNFLVTGTGKCGTVYMSHLLTELGIPCGHEAIFTNKGLEEAKKRLKNKNLIKFSECTKNLPNWTCPQEIISDSSYMSAPFLDWDYLENTKIIHLIRNPIDVISSFIKGEYFDLIWPPLTVPFQKFIKSNIPHVYENDLNNINRCALYYIEWNKIIESKLNNRNFIIHAIEKPLEKIYEFIEKSPKEEIKINKKINSWNPKKISINEIIPEIREKVIDISERYGYNGKIL